MRIVWKINTSKDQSFCITNGFEMQIIDDAQDDPQRVVSGIFTKRRSAANGGSKNKQKAFDSFRDSR